MTSRSGVLGVQLAGWWGEVGWIGKEVQAQMFFFFLVFYMCLSKATSLPQMQRFVPGWCVFCMTVEYQGT